MVILFWYVAVFMCLDCSNYKPHRPSGQQWTLRCSGSIARGGLLSRRWYLVELNMVCMSVILALRGQKQDWFSGQHGLYLKTVGKTVVPPHHSGIVEEAQQAPSVLPAKAMNDLCEVLFSLSRDFPKSPSPHAVTLEATISTYKIWGRQNH